jgi:predicted N-formylglutamate amidohydrolase
LLLNALRGRRDIFVGDNEPYPIDDDFDYTIPTHGDARGLPCVMIEIRQDGIRTAEGVEAWAARLVMAYREIEADALNLLCV